MHTTTKIDSRTSSLSSVSTLLHKLHSIKFGTPASQSSVRISSRSTAHLFDTLALLLENGLTLRRALAAVAADGALKKYRQIMRAICHDVNAGQTFSSALGAYPKSFSPVIVKQLRIAEKSGTVVESLRRIATNLEYKRELRSRVIKKLSYPGLVVFAGTGLICFMMLFVVPQFEQMYAESKVELPAITRFVSATSRFFFRFGWILIVAAITTVAITFRLRRHAACAKWIDRQLLRIPMFGSLLRDTAVLQFFDAMGAMIESGFVPVDAIVDSVDAVGNRAARETISQVRHAVIRGETLSGQMSRHSEIFPLTVSQLVFVGEQTGNLIKATLSVRQHLSQRIENRVNAIVASLEPFLTISLAITIGVVVLAIYMPMFRMFEVLE